MSVPKQDINITQGRRPNFAEFGNTGLSRFGGYVYEEFITTLRYPRAAKVYKEMASNDPVIGAILYMAEQLIRNATWRVEAASESAADKEAAAFLESCMNDMSMTWNDTITEILSMITYGWSWHEIVYKKRDGDVKDPTRKSKYNDGRIGWRRIPGRSQESLHEWIFDDEDGGILAMEQLVVSDGTMRVIPIEKSLLFRTKTERNNPEGRSLLRNAYRPWYFKKHIEEIEGIGIERDLAGLPILTTPEGVDLWNPDDVEAQRTRIAAETLVQNIRRDQNEGIVLPFGWNLQLLSTGSRRQFDTNAILNRYDQRIAITMLADIVMLGADKVGSFALADVKKSLLGAALEAQTKSIAETFNRYAVPRLFSFNTFQGLSDYPRILPSEVETPDLQEIATYIEKMAKVGALFPDKDLEGYLRNAANLPKAPEGAWEERQAEKQQAKELMQQNLESKNQSEKPGTQEAQQNRQGINRANAQKEEGDDIDD